MEKKIFGWVYNYWSIVDNLFINLLRSFIPASAGQSIVPFERR